MENTMKTHENKTSYLRQFAMQTISTNHRKRSIFKDTKGLKLAFILLLLLSHWLHEKITAT
jgi:hypothetical protein